MSVSNWAVTLDVESTPVHFKIDTGADVTVLGLPTFLKLSNVTLTPPDGRLEGPDGNAVNIAGKFDCLLSYKGVTSLQTIYVIHPGDRASRRRPALKALHIIGTIREVNTADTTKYRNLFPSLFGKLGRLDGEYTI